LKLGADVNAVDANGETAMHGAAYRNHPRVVQLLADKGAKIAVWNRPNKTGLTPLVIAEGHRPGLNFRPSPETVAALHRVMIAAGVTPPKATPRPAPKSGYEDGTKKPAPRGRCPLAAGFRCPCKSPIARRPAARDDITDVADTNTLLRGTSHAETLSVFDRSPPGNHRCPGSSRRRDGSRGTGAHPRHDPAGRCQGAA